MLFQQLDPGAGVENDYHEDYEPLQRLIASSVLEALRKEEKWRRHLTNKVLELISHGRIDRGSGTSIDWTAVGSIPTFQAHF